VASLIDGRLLVDVDSDAAVEVVAELFDLAGIAKPATTCKAIVRTTPAWLMDEVAAFHAALLKAYDEASASRTSKLVPLDLTARTSLRLAGVGAERGRRTLDTLKILVGGGQDAAVMASPVDAVLPRRSE
jgi:hypothetical protein